MVWLRKTVILILIIVIIINLIMIMIMIINITSNGRSAVNFKLLQKSLRKLGLEAFDGKHLVLISLLHFSVTAFNE